MDGGMNVVDLLIQIALWAGLGIIVFVAAIETYLHFSKDDE